MTKLYAQPYDIDASGFYFDDANTYATKAAANRNQYGQLVDEYEIQFIDGERIDAAFADAAGLNQCNIETFFKAVDDWSDDTKTRFIIANGECGYSLPLDQSSADQVDLDIYHVETLTELAEQFVDDGLFGEVPDVFAHYIDYAAIARDLSADYSMTDIAGTRLAYRCG